MKEQIGGLDALRCLATVLVAWQHAASVAGFYAQTQWHGVSPGQAGVALFCAIAGLLAGTAASSEPGRWLVRRALRIYPAYWLATLGAFALVLVFGGKTMSWGLFLSQMLGTGYFTHGGGLVNVVSWFVSLILLCYVLAAIGRRLRCAGAVMGIAALIALVLVVTRTEVVLSRHVLVFTLAALVTGYPRAVCSVAAVLLAFAMYIPDPQLAYPAIGLGGVMLARALRPEHPALSLGARYSYEFFLVHGILLVGVTRFLGLGALAIAAALLSAALAAVLLHAAQMPLQAYLRRLLESSGHNRSLKEPVA